MKKFSIGEILKPTIVLAVICIVTSAALAFTNSITKDIIADTAAQKATETRGKVLAATVFEEKKLDDTTYYVGKDADEKTVGYVFTTNAKSYGGDISVMVGVKTDGTVSGVEILSINDTPGLGMNAKNETFLDQFIDKAAGITVNKNNPGENEIKALTGATVTSSAVTDAVNQALDYYSEITGGADNG